MMIDFVHLHVHSDYSLLDGAASVQSLADKAEALGMKHLAITDHGNMFGVLKFVTACKEHADHSPRAKPIHPIIGNEFYMAPGSRFEKNGAEHGNKYYHLILLAKDTQGYKNLLKLTSISYIDGFYYKPRIDEEVLVQYHEGLICLSACVAGEIPSLILENKMDEAEKRARWFRGLFGDENFYLELQDHRLEIQKTANAAIIDIAKRTGIPLVVTNDIHYLEKKDAEAQDILLCISTQKKRAEKKRMRFDTDEFYFKTGDEMAALFPEYPEAVANTVRIAERCKTEIPKIKTKDLPKYLPECDIPFGFNDANEYLRHLTFEGLTKRYPDYGKEIRERAEYELDVIIKMGFTGYFLIVADFINWAKEHGIAVGPGRGSGAGSITAYALRITDIEPLKYDLLFERFLNPERVSMPDFDVDFCNERRDEVIRYVTEKYGKNRVGQIITFGTLKAKAVIKDVARVLDIPLSEANMIANLIPKDPKMTLKRAFEEEPKLRELEENPKYQELFVFARKLEGKNRNSSLHAAGIVIGKTDLVNYVPLYKDPKTGGVASQYTMDVIEEQGLVKMDFLGLKNLDLIKNTVDLIKERGDEYADFNIDAIPEDDEATFRMLGEGKSSGIFQFESQGMQNVLKQAKPTSIEDLIALNALYRPGPMDYIPQFIESKWGRQPIVYPDPCLEDILKETYGVIVYQEQVMQVAQRIAGYSLGQADMLRRAMGKKKREIIDKEKAPFIAGAIKNGFKETDADRIYEILVPFANYGFNKSHAAAYSVVAYQTAYLKANFSAEFMSAKLTNEISGTDSLPAYIDEARKMGLAIDPPDINRSDRYFSVADGRIVYGFLGIKGLGEGPANEIIACREKDGPYKSFMDFLERVDIKAVGKKVVELLARTGAFDSFGITRATLVFNLEQVVEYVQKNKEEKAYGQSGLFDNAPVEQQQSFRFVEKPEWTRMEKLQIEKELIGFYFSGHPMDDFKDVWEKYSTLNLAELDAAEDGMYAVVGMIKDLKPHHTNNGEMGFSAIADYNGDVDLVLFADSWARAKNSLAIDRVVAIRGKINTSEMRDKPSLLVDSVLNLEKNGLTREAIDAFFSHPLDKYRKAWEQNCTLNLAQAAGVKDGVYTLVGVIKSVKPYQTSKGGDMAFSSIEDFNGQIDLVIFSDTWEKCRNTLTVDTLVALKGKLDKSRRPDRPSVIVNEFLDVDHLQNEAESNPKDAAKKAGGKKPPKQPAMPRPGAAAGEHTRAESYTADVSQEEKPPAASIHIRLTETAAETDNTLFILRDALLEKPGSSTVYLHVPDAGRETVIRTTSQIKASADDAALEIYTHCGGVEKVWTE
ncbi:MAG: DNA polymerase III subunit alpha [Treponema sp.]|nr:DNA polymerase III subunit alpha [Treponema sp.]